MNAATEVDLFSSLGNGGRGSQERAGSGGLRGAQGSHLLSSPAGVGDCAFRRSPFPVLTSVTASVTLQDNRP